MTSLYVTQEEFVENNPLDIIENIVVQNDWAYDRQGNEELTVGVEGSWCQYHLWFSWRADVQAVHFSCAYDMKIPAKNAHSVYELLAKVNEKLWVGHFDSWQDEGLVMFRHTLLFKGLSAIPQSQIEDIIEIGMGEMEKFYPAVQFCLWGGKSPTDAIDAAMLETMGEA